MHERLHSGLSPEALTVLASLDIQEAAPDVVAVNKQEKISLKDKPYLDILQDQPELAKEIQEAMTSLDEHGLPVPIFHITSRAVRFPDGTEESTGYLENIAQNGLRARDTNVAVLMERSAQTRVASPAYFKEYPHKFLRAMATSLGHYSHHGSRTNKATLGDRRDQGKGVPVMLVINPVDMPLVTGADYDDHFMLGEVADPSRIVGVIDLDGRRAKEPLGIAGIAKQYLDTAEAMTVPQHTADDVDVDAMV